MAVVAIVAWVTGIVGASFPGDAISPAAAISFAVGIGVRALIAGSIAFALAPFFGRGAAAGIAGALMLGGYVVHSYRTVVPAFDTLVRRHLVRLDRRPPAAGRAVGLGRGRPDRARGAGPRSRSASRGSRDATWG